MLNNNLYGLVKREYDKTLRALQMGPKAGTTYKIDSETLEPSVSKPSVDLEYHKTSDDHDGRYYTEEEINTLLSSLIARYSEEFINTDPWVINHGLGYEPVVTIWEELIPLSVFGTQPFGTSYFGGSDQVVQIADPAIAVTKQESPNQMTVTWGTNKSGKVVYVG